MFLNPLGLGHFNVSVWSVRLLQALFAPLPSGLLAARAAGGGSRCWDGRQEVNVTDTGMGLQKRQQHHDGEKVKPSRLGTETLVSAQEKNELLRASWKWGIGKVRWCVLKPPLRAGRRQRVCSSTRGHPSSSVRRLAVAVTHAHWTHRLLFLYYGPVACRTGAALARR